MKPIETKKPRPIKIVEATWRIYYGPRLVKGSKTRMTKRSYQQQVFPGDPLYEKALFGAHFIFWSTPTIYAWDQNKHRCPCRRTNARKK